MVIYYIKWATTSWTYGSTPINYNSPTISNPNTSHIQVWFDLFYMYTHGKQSKEMNHGVNSPPPPKKKKKKKKQKKKRTAGGGGGGN